MTLSISLSPDSEARLRERAAAEGKDVAAFVRETIEEKLAATAPAGAAPAQGTPEWLARLNEWVAIHPPRPYLADDSRDAIYSPDRD
jgi:hypothetical protein